MRPRMKRSYCSNPELCFMTCRVTEKTSILHTVLYEITYSFTSDCYKEVIQKSPALLNKYLLTENLRSVRGVCKIQSLSKFLLKKWTSNMIEIMYIKPSEHLLSNQNQAFHSAVASQLISNDYQDVPCVLLTSVAVIIGVTCHHCSSMEISGENEQLCLQPLHHCFHLLFSHLFSITHECIRKVPVQVHAIFIEPVSAQQSGNTLA